MTVTVNNLLVDYVQTESDGDWHVAVTDGQVPVFITEIIPSNQAALGMPVPGTVIDETGVPYCDTFHQFQSWHGNTCWEIHPVLSWQSAGTAATYTTHTIGHGVNVNTLFSQNPIPRGSYQTISTSVSDSDGPVANAAVSIEVDYASAYATRYFSCVTSASGSCDIGWTVGSTADPGTFTVITTVRSQEFT